MRLVVIGTGYVGLVAGACLAHAGHDVICVEKDIKKLAALKKGQVTFYEPELEPLLNKYYTSGTLRFTGDLAEALPGAEVAFIAVGTPEGEDGQADLSYVCDVAAEIGNLAEHKFIVVDKSTVPVGTQEKVARIINSQVESRGLDFTIEVVSNPEFLRQGAAVHDFLYPDRVIIGANTEQVFSTMVKVYEGVVDTSKIFWMDPKSAEMTKYAANAFLATKISFINEMSNICDAVGANIELVAKGIGSDPRISPHFLNAGTGYGGSCFPKDVKALIFKAQSNNYSPKILEAVDDINQRQKLKLVEKFVNWHKEQGTALAGEQVTVWGLSFKPETDDLREAPSFYVIEQLLNLGCKVVAYDPQAMSKAKNVFDKRVNYANSAMEALHNSSALFILTEWREFRSILPEEISTQVNLVLDGRNIYDPQEMALVGVDYLSIGRPTVRGQVQEKNVLAVGR